MKKIVKSFAAFSLVISVAFSGCAFVAKDIIGKIIPQDKNTDVSRLKGTNINAGLLMNNISGQQIVIGASIDEEGKLTAPVYLPEYLQQELKVQVDSIVDLVTCKVEESKDLIVRAELTDSPLEEAFRSRLIHSSEIRVFDDWEDHGKLISGREAIIIIDGSGAQTAFREQQNLIDGYVLKQEFGLEGEITESIIYPHEEITEDMINEVRALCEKEG